MDGMSSETNEENDNMERPVRRRHSSILKPPRSPLQDLRGGNEAVQESNALRNKKSSRRVSFADTIKVFQTESHMKIVRKSEIAETEAGENVLYIQNKKPEETCEITGMNTLLSAPIQTQMQQREISITEHNHEMKPANDQTVIFSDENQMDLTASHTVMITKDLLDCTKSEKSIKIDTASFLANLKLHTKDSRMKKELNFSMDQSTSSEKKIHFNDFIKRLKTGKSNAFPTGPDKENFEISVHPIKTKKASSVHQMHVSLRVDENSSNTTRIFGEQNDGMNFTQCHTANIQTLVPTSSKASIREFKGDDITIYGSDFMDLTTNHTIQNLPSADNSSNKENQTQNVMMEVMTDYGTKAPGGKTIFNKLNIPFQTPLNPNGEIHITKSHITGTETHTGTQTSNQDAKTLTIIPESICSSPATQDYKTFFYSSSNNAMELTTCLSGMRKEKNLLKNDNYSKMYPNPDAISLLTEKTIYSGEDSMDITRSHTVAIDNQIFKQDQTNIQKADTSISEKEIMLQNLITISKDGKMNINCSSVPHISKGRLQQSLANSLSISLIDKKTEIFTGEDMDLTESHTTNLGSQAPLTSYNVTSENTSKFLSHNKSPSDEWQEMTKSRTEPSQQPDIISKNIPMDTGGKEKVQVLKIAPYVDKDSPQSADINQDLAISHSIVYSDRSLEKQVALGNNRNTVPREQSLFPTTESFSLGQSNMKNHNIAINSYAMKSVPGQNSKLPEPLRKSVGNPSPDYSHDKTIICSEEEQNMDLTKSHTVVIGFSPSEIQELGKTNLQNTNSLLTTANRQTAIKVEKCCKSLIEKTGISVSKDNLDVIEDKSIQKLGFLNEKQDVKICGRKSIGRQKVDKTIVFSEGDENDMDITKIFTVGINHKPLLLEQDSHLAGTSKTVLYECGQDDVEITKSHTTALECITVSPDKITSRPMDKTVMFVDSYNELEMTKSHTVFIDYQAMERTVSIDKLDPELSKRRKSIEKPKMTPASAEESVSFLENGESDHLAANVNKLTLLREWSNNGPIEKAVGFIAGDNMEVSKFTIWKNGKDVQKPEFLNDTISDKSQRRKSLRLKNDKTAAFSKNDDDMDITQSCTVKINYKGAPEDREDSHLVPLTGASKTVLYSCGQDDMEMTRSHTTALECKTVSPDKITTRPIDKTVMFVDNHGDLEVTESHTVFIDCQDTEKINQECPKFGIATGKPLGISFHNDGSSVQEITEKQALAVDQTYIPEKARIGSCQLNSTDRRNMDFTNSQATATCESSDNYSCLPNAISCFDNLEGNVMSLGDKDKKASNCPVQNDLSYVKDLANEYYLKPEGLPPSACSLLKKEKVTQTNTNGQLDCVTTVLKDQDMIKESQNLIANQTLQDSQELAEMIKPNSNRVSFKPPKDQMEGFVDTTEHNLKKTVVDNDNVCVTSQPHLSSQVPPLPQQGRIILNKDETISSNSGNKNLNIVIGNSFVPTCENEAKMLNNDKQFTIVCKNELRKNTQTAKCNTDFHSNSDLTKQVIQTHTNSREASDTVIASNTASFNSVRSNLNNLNGKTEEFLDFQTPHIPSSPEQILALINKAHNHMSIVQATEIQNINTAPSNVEDDRDEESKISHNGAETNSVPLKTVVKDKVKRCSLGIFLPRLPNKRNCSVTGINDLKQIQADTTDLNHLEIQPVFNKEPSIEFVATKLTLSPSQYINEENFPIYPGEINSSDSITIETEEKALIETYQKGIPPSENKIREICSNQKRTWVQEDDDIQNEKKIRKSEIRCSDTTQDQEIFDHHAEGDIDKNANSLSRTPSSCSSSLDSIKADGTSLDFSTQHNSQMESQFLRDTICEESLKEKLKDGKITIKEFFILLQVHILIQKPRQSNLPAKFTVNTPPTLEDLMLSQYVYRPKIQIYREDCEALCQKIEELKLSALNQDKLLTDINRNLWEKMRHCSDEELKVFGIYLNKIKSHFTKMTKVFTHQGKVALYTKLVQSAQNERKKLQIRIDEMDNILKKIENCLAEVEIETKNLDEEKDNPMEVWDSEMRAAEKELEQLKTEEDELQRNLLELEVQKEQTLAQIDFVQKQTDRTEELMDQLSLSEWEAIEWSDDQAVFTFLYDTIELTITFGETVVDLPFLDKACRKIVDLNFQSRLDEDKAPPSSLLVHKLIFQYIEEKESWKKKCTTQHQIPKMLQEISLVVSHCRLLGEEIEFLKRWGPNYNLMNIDVTNTKLRLLFSSSAAFAKFEITLPLSVHFPTVPLPFSIQKHLGNIGQDEITAILSKVPLKNNYLKNVVKQIYQDLLQDCHFYH